METGNAFDQIAPSYTTVSSSSSYSSLQCDIFINHCGVDVKHKLASTIYHTLDLLGLRAFLDVEVLEAGDVIPVEIEAAMDHASLHIAIFSPNYAQSPWCLAELSFMIKTGTKIIPIFYYVDPSDLRWVAQKKGIYAHAFSQHQEKGRYTSEKLQEWMKALHDVSFLLGYRIKDDSGDEGRMLKNVVNCVLRAMKRDPLDVAKHSVGMDEAKHQTVKIEGVVRMGGSGKTTLAKELFNRKRSLSDTKINFTAQFYNSSLEENRKAKTSYQCAQNATCKDKGWGDGYAKGIGCTGVFGRGSLFWILKLRKSKRDKEKNFQRNRGDHLEKLIPSRGVECMKLFSLKEIKKATNKFSQNLILGSGGYGTVYKGTLTNGCVVAVKKSNHFDSKEINQFINEVSILSQINHRNVVKLLGCCLETSVPLLVYEYISNGPLFDHLHGNKKEQQQLPWEKRLCIAIETAETLSYLHSAAPIPIVHRDVKSSNILLDNNYNPKVADFGVSRLIPMGQTHITTAVQGTLGYLDPEYFQTVQLTEKSDVYSFGVVLVELLTGLQPISYERMKNHTNLATFFLYTINTRGLGEIIDPRLNVDEDENMESMTRVAKLAKECLNIEGVKRPSMKEVVQELLWSKGGERPHAWLNNDIADNPEEMVDEEERSDGIMSTYSIPHQCSSSFGIGGLRDFITTLLLTALLVSVMLNTYLVSSYSIN